MNYIKDLPNPLYPIGMKFTLVRHRTKTKKDEQICTIVDHLFTYNAKNELVNFRYVTEHDFLGQKMINRDVVQVTIQRALWEKERRNETRNAK